MNPDEQSRSDEICVVCGKDTSSGRGFMTLHLEGRHLALCCPMCQKVYQENPAQFARRLKTGDAIREIESALGLPHST